MSDELKGFSFKPIDNELMNITGHTFTTPIVTELKLASGSLKFSEGKFSFEGDAYESAKELLDFLNAHGMGKTAQLEQEVLQLTEQNKELEDACSVWKEKALNKGSK